MSPKIRLTKNEKKLTGRYLIWCYKTTKEALDRIDRYFTQLKVDAFMLKEMKRLGNSEKTSSAYEKKLKDFAVYMDKKEANVLPKKYSDKKKKILHPEYLYLKNRLTSILNAIRYFLGVKEAEKIIGLYEEEMTRRILTSTDNH